MKPTKYLSTQQVAAKLGVTRETVRRWCERGEMRAMRPGRHYRIPYTEVERRLEALGRAGAKGSAR